MTKPKRDADGKIPRITKTCKVVLASSEGQRFTVGEFTLTEPEPGPTLEQFANEAFKAARSSLARLMTPYYRIIVIDGKREEGYGLDKWIKLFDKSSPNDTPSKKQPIHKKAAA